MKCPFNPQGHGEFRDKNELGSHIQAVHFREINTPITPIPTVPNSSGVVTKIKENLDAQPPVRQLTPEELMKIAEQKKQFQKEASKYLNQPTTPPKPKESVPIELQYKFSGTCPTCNTEVVTLSFEIDNMLYCIAYCDKERKQIKSQRVIPINRQFPLQVQQSKKTNDNGNKKKNAVQHTVRQVSSSHKRVLPSTDSGNAV
jgi:hypothetical protein